MDWTRFIPKSIAGQLSLVLGPVFVCSQLLALHVIELDATQRQHTHLREEVDRILLTHVPELSDQMWNFNLQLNSHIEILGQIPFIAGVRLTDVYGRVIASTGIDPKDGDERLRFDVALSRPEAHGPVPLGTLSIVAHDREIVAEMKARGWRNLLAMVVIDALAALVGTLVLRRIVSDPMKRLKSNIEDASRGVAITVSDQKVHSELGDVIEAFGVMHAQRVQAEAEVLDHRMHLEEMVLSRTEALRTSEAHFRNLIEFAPVPMVYTIDDGNRFQFNVAFVKWTGYDVDHVKGMNDWFAQVYPDPQYRAERTAESRRCAELALATGRTVVLSECRFVCKTGAICDVVISAAPVGDRLLWAYDDVTKRRRAEAVMREAQQVAEAANQSKSDFLANMSHEIRTPMNAIMGMAHLAQRTELTPKQRDYLEKITKAAKSLLSIINDILDFSKIEAGKLELENAPFALDEALGDVVDIVGLKAHEKGLEILLAVDPAAPQHLVGDSLRLRQILINLVNNAVKFTERGEIVVSVRPDAPGHTPDDGTAALRITVRDTGLGMTPDQMAGLFQVFSQADSSITRRFGGTGLGLAISKQLVELMGGTISVDSTPGQGSTFTFTARFGLAPTAPGTAEPTPAVDLRGKRVLVVDDSESARQIMVDMLSAHGLVVETADSGAMGLAALARASRQHQHFDLVLMDWRMPEMDGIETSRRIKADRRLSRAPAVLMVTAYGREDVMHLAEGIGLNGLLIKPVSESILMETIANLFQHSPVHAITTAQQPALPTEAEQVTHLQGRRVLLVEDNEINRLVALELLADLGLVVEVAVNGREGVERATAEPFDLVLMDVQMPEMDGLTATRMIRAHAGLRALPILAMTAHAMRGDREKSLQAGMNDHLVKPIDPQELERMLRHWMPQAPAGSMAQTTAVQMAVDAATAVLPSELPPFDIATALLRTNGKARLLRDLIVMFHRDFAHAVPQLRQCLADGRFADAERLAHSLKGVAGTLEVAGLPGAAAALEDAIHKGAMDTMEELVDTLERYLTPALVVAASLCSTSHATPASDSAAAKHAASQPAASDAEVLAAVVELQRYFATNNLKGCKRFTQLRGVLCGRGADAQVHALGEHLDQLDFQAAAEVLQSMASQWGFMEAAP